MRNKTSKELLLDMSVDSLPLSEEAKIRIKRFHINTVRDLLYERAVELDQLIGRKYINEIRLFMMVNDLLFQDGQPLQLELDFHKSIKLIDNSYEIRQFDFNKADCYPTFELWEAVLLFHGLVLVSFSKLLCIHFKIENSKRIVGEQNVQRRQFFTIQDKKLVNISPASLVEDSDWFVFYKL